MNGMLIIVQHMWIPLCTDTLAYKILTSVAIVIHEMCVHSALHTHTYTHTRTRTRTRTRTDTRTDRQTLHVCCIGEICWCTIVGDSDVSFLHCYYIHPLWNSLIWLRVSNLPSTDYDTCGGDFFPQHIAFGHCPPIHILEICLLSLSVTQHHASTLYLCCLPTVCSW
jgi:hypothetical protein